MRFAVLPVSVSDRPRVTTLTRVWIERACGSVKRYIEDQSGGRASPEFDVFDWLSLSLTAEEWMKLGGNVSDVVNEEVVEQLAINPSEYDRFIYIIDYDEARSAVYEGNEIRMGAIDFDPAILAHEVTHVYGAGESFLNTPHGPMVYDALFCIMGRENSKYSYRDATLLSPEDGADVSHTDCGPGMCTPTLLANNWLDLAKHGVEVTGFTTGLTGSTARIRALEGAPRGDDGLPVCCSIDDGDRYLVEYRVPRGWDVGLPTSDNGWLIVYRTPINGPLVTLEVASFPVMPGRSVALGAPDHFYLFGAGPLRLSVMSCDVSGGTVDIRFFRQKGKVPEHFQPFEGFLPDDGCLLWTLESGWRTFQTSSDLGTVVTKVAELDEIRELARVSPRGYASDLADAGRRQHVALQEAVAGLGSSSTSPKTRLVDQLGRLRGLLADDDSPLNTQDVRRELEGLESIARQLR